MRHLKRIGPVLAVFGMAFMPLPALADSIDGDWCSDEGRRISIDGPQIISPGGKRFTGLYGRYDVSFEMPAGEPDAASRVDMRLRRGDPRVIVKIGAGEPKPWRRCPPGIS